MNSFVSFYDLLGVSKDASPVEIKDAYRKRAKTFHPDVNNSEDAHIIFASITNAYETLRDDKKRSLYDLFISKSTSVKTKESPKKKNKAGTFIVFNKDFFSVEEIISHINILLWDIEIMMKDNEENLDFIIDGIPLRKHLVKILIQIDAWILYPSGFVDYFMEARQMRELSIEDYIHFIGEGGEQGHRPFYTLESYYYDVRKRIDKFINKTTFEKLLEPAADSGKRLYEVIIETQNYVIEYMIFIQNFLR